LNQLVPFGNRPGSEGAASLKYITGAYLIRGTGFSQGTPEVTTAKGVEFALDGYILRFVNQQTDMNVVRLIGVGDANARISGFAKVN
jgi:hypothetical protein